ncbi:MAG: hypothetical protein Q8O89_04500 [Nanoarchaeota archaeon]|nr:hypothetical protein [Nanoarchaeota archaeon]
MIDTSTLLKHYKRPEIQEAIVENCKDREIAIKFGDKGFGKRPDTLKYPRDVLELALQGATSFHASEELWRNPLMLNPAMKKKEFEDLRKGWDLVLDIDCNHLEYSKVAADILIQALKFQGIKSVSCKFSGRAGFHIGVPFEAFPEIVHGKETRLLFPDGARAIAMYLKEMIKNPLAERLLSEYKLDGIMKTTGKKFEELIIGSNFNPFSVLDIDTILISPRHLYRMPYCFNEKSGFVSIVIDPKKAASFDVETAHPKNVVVSKFKFLDKTKSEKDEGRTLIIQAFDFAKRKETEKIEREEKHTILNKEKRDQEKEFAEITKPLAEELFPPCIKKILKGMDDGKKRALFILINFLTSVGWNHEAVEKRLKEWNEKNKEQLKEVYLLGQLRYHKQQKKKVLPPNCLNKMYYTDLQLCGTDKEPLCKRIKNPVNYTIVKDKSLKEQEEKGNRRKKAKGTENNQQP